MQYESLFEKSSALPQGCLSLQFVRCHQSDVAWSTEDVEHLHELSVQYFRKHGRNKNGRSVSCWIDCGQNGLAVRVKADKIALQPDRVVKYRLNLRRSVNKILKLQSSSPSESNGPLPKRETSVVYVPVTHCSGLELHADFFLEHESDPERRRRIVEAIPADSCIRIPSEPFCAVKMRVYGKGEPLITSVSGKDVSISFMTRKKAEQCGVAESAGQVEEFFPPKRQPEIEEIYRETMEKKCCRSDPPLEKNTGNTDVPPLVQDGTTSESTEKLGALSLLSASVGIAPDVESKEVDCLPRNYGFHHKRSSVEPVTVPGISSALEQSVHGVRRGHQKTLFDSVAEKNTGNPDVPPTPVLDGTIATLSRRESTEVSGAPSLMAASAGIASNVVSKKADCLQLNSLGHSQSSAETLTVSSAFEHTPLNSRQSFCVVKSGNQNTTFPNPVAEKNTGNPNVSHPVLDGTTPISSGRESTNILGGPSLLTTTASADIAPSVESGKADCLPLNSQGHSQSYAVTVTAVSSALVPAILNSRQSSRVVRSGNRTTLSNSVAEKNTGNVPHLVIDGTTLSSSEYESTEILGALSLLTAPAGIAPNAESKKVDCLPLNSLGHTQSSLNYRQSFHLFRSNDRITLPDPVAENNTRNPDVPPLVLDGTIPTFSRRESTEILGAPSLLAASTGIAPNTESKRADCLPLNFHGHSQTSSDPAIVPVISNAFKPTPLNSRQYFNFGNRTTLPNSVAEKNTGNPNVPHPVIDGTTPTSSGHVLAKMLGAPSLLTTASANITSNVESKKRGCLPLNSLGHFQPSSDLTTVPVISNAFKTKILNSRQYYYGVRSGNQNTTLPNSVACPLHNQKVRVLDFLPQDRLILKNSVITSMTSKPPISDSLVAVRAPEQSPDVSFSIKKLLVARCLFLIVRSKKVGLDSKDINTLIHCSVRTQVFYGTIAVSVPVRKEGRSIVCYTPSYDQDEVLRFIEYSPVNLMIFTRMKCDCSVLMALAKFHNSIVTKNYFEATQLLKQYIDFHTWNVLANELQIDEVSVIPELPKSSQQNRPGGILRAVAELSEIDGRLKPRQNTRSETIAATPQARVQKTDFVTVVEQNTMASTQPGLNRKRYRYCPTAVAPPSEPKTLTILESSTPDLPSTTKNNAAIPSSTNFDRPAPDRRQTVTTTAFSQSSDGRLVMVSRQSTCLRHRFLTRVLIPSRPSHLPIVAASTMHCQPSYSCFSNSFKK